MDDAETDPELAMALRISLEEQRARQDTVSAVRFFSDLSYLFRTVVQNKRTLALLLQLKAKQWTKIEQCSMLL